MNSNTLITHIDNLKSCAIYLWEISRLFNKISILEENEKVLLSFSSAYYNKEKQSEELSIDSFIPKIGNYYKNPEVLWNTVLESNDKSCKYKQLTCLVLKYHCDDLKRFYTPREELTPVNINNCFVSSINRKIIKGKHVKMRNNKVVLSQSHALEWFKNCVTCPLSLSENPEELFIPY
jgi:hypothetical protein